jgi:hypothetical protein
MDHAILWIALLQHCQRFHGLLGTTQTILKAHWFAEVLTFLLRLHFLRLLGHLLMLTVVLL